MKSVILKKPIVLSEGAGSITKLDFREEVVAGDLRGVPFDGLNLTDNLLKVAGRLCSQPDVVMNRLSFADLMEVARMVGVFLEDGRPTGSTP